MNESNTDLEARNLTKEDPEWWVNTKYHGSVRECGFTIRIPPSDGPLDKYRATLGHKLNHSFKPNCEYGGVLDTPRFGLTRAFYTNRAIKKDEELFISYGYSVTGGPIWYRELYQKMVDDGENIPEKDLDRILHMKEDKPEEELNSA